MVSADLFFSLESYAHKALWIEGGSLWSPLHLLKDYLKSENRFRIEIEIPPGVYLEHPEWISIGKGTVIEPGVYIQGPCIIGKRCRIRHGAYIRESVIIGNDCVIGHSAEIKHSILLDRSFATHFVYVGDSLVGNGVNLGAGVKCANLRLDREEIQVQFEGIRYPTGLKKLGAIIGDLSQIGCNCVLNPGTLMGRESSARPLLNLGGYIAAGSEVTSRGIKTKGVSLLKQMRDIFGYKQHVD